MISGKIIKSAQSSTRRLTNEFPAFPAGTNKAGGGIIEAHSSGGVMAVPVSQMWTVASYVLRQKLAGRERYPLVLMLEPLFRCQLACAGCGQKQNPDALLKTDL